MTHPDRAEEARAYAAGRLDDADVVRAGRRLAIELRAERRRTARGRRTRLLTTPIVSATTR